MAPPKTINTELNLAASNVVNLGDHFPTPDNFRLTVALQTTLEVEELLGIFSRETAAVVPHTGVTYRLPEHNLELGIGHRARHMCNYQLSLQGERLGELSLSAKHRFSERDLVQIEYLLCALVYPLRNAIRFQAIRNAAHRDPLTGLGNRGAMLDAMQREIQLARRNGSALSLLALDLDHFKRINDCHGHSTGDAVLQATAERMRTATRGTDLLFRYGGEEFVAVLAHTGKEHAIQVAERIRSAIACDPVAHGGERLNVTVSIGVATQDGAADHSVLFDRADAALYRAKRQGRNRVEAHNA